MSRTTKRPRKTLSDEVQRITKPYKRRRQHSLLDEFEVAYIAN